MIDSRWSALVASAEITSHHLHLGIIQALQYTPVEQLGDEVQGVSPGGQLAATTLTVLVAVAVVPWASVTENVTL